MSISIFTSFEYHNSTKNPNKIIRVPIEYITTFIETFHKQKRILHSFLFIILNSINNGINIEKTIRKYKNEIKTIYKRK